MPQASHLMARAYLQDKSAVKIVSAEWRISLRKRATNTDAGVTGREINLGVRDRKLAKLFAEASSRVLGEDVRLEMYDSSPGRWSVRIGSIFLVDISQRVRDEPELIFRFLTTDQSKIDYCRLFFAYGGGPSIIFSDKHENIHVRLYASEDFGTIEALRKILADLRIKTPEPYSKPRSARTYEISVEPHDQLKRFAELIGMDGYKDEKLKDALWLKERFEERATHGMERREALGWAQNVWESYYQYAGARRGWIPNWLSEALEVAHSDMPLEEKIVKTEEIYEEAEEKNRSLRSTMRY